MNSDNIGKEYTTKDIANIVDIAPPTVRKYAQFLEKAGYRFFKNEKGFRIFTDKDIFTFKEMKEVSKKDGMPVERIAELIVSNQNKKARHEADSDTVIIQAGSGIEGDIVPHDTRYSELMSKLSKLDMLDDMAKELQELRVENKVLAEQMKEQQEYIKKSDERRDKQLMESIRLVQEMKKAQLEIAISQQQETKKGFFSRLFNKK